MQLVIAGKESQAVDYLTFIPASPPMLCMWSFPSHKNLHSFGTGFVDKAIKILCLCADNKKVKYYKLAEAILSFDVSLCLMLGFFSPTNTKFLKTHPIKPIHLSQVRKWWEAGSPK